jgi:hypothetical protein
VIEPSRPQLSFAEGPIQEQVGPLWEEWMREVDALLADRELVQIVYEALARRYPRSRTRGRAAHPGRCRAAAAALEAHAQLELSGARARGTREPGVPAVHPGGSSEGSRCQDARPTRPGARPRDHRAGPSASYRGGGVVRGRRLRMDTTVVESDIHYPTDSSLLGDGVRKRISKIAGWAGARLRRAVDYQVLERMNPLVRQVTHQALERLFKGNTQGKRLESNAGSATPEVAHRLRGSHQSVETPSRPEPLSLQRDARDRALGRLRRHR